MSQPTSEAPDFELGEAAELGAVDERGVRVWVRRPGAEEVSARLEVEGHAPVTATARPSAETDWTAAIELALPTSAPERAFVCTVSGRRLMGRLAAAPGVHTGLTFGFGSCHQPFEETPEGGLRVRPVAIYPAALEHLRGAGARLLLLLGDQIYSDVLPSLDVTRGLAGAAEGAPMPALEELIERYRRVTRLYFAQSGFRALREAFPTYCMWDDHEIFDNWGSRLARSELDGWLFEAASRVFCEYQALRNPGGRLGPPPYGFTFRHGDIGFLVLDQRGVRDHGQGLMLGAAQWEWLQAALRGELDRDVQTLFIGVTVPVAHMSRWMAKAFDQLPGSYGDAVRDRWCAGRFVSSRDALLAELFAWQARARERQVFLLSGDIHAASSYTVRERGGPGVLHQLTSSALTMTPETDARVYSFMGTRSPNLFEPRWRFQRHFLCFDNNFGTVRVEPLPDGGHRVTFQVLAWDAARRSLALRGQLVAEPGTEVMDAPRPFLFKSRPRGRAP